MLEGFRGEEKDKAWEVSRSQMLQSLGQVVRFYLYLVREWQYQICVLRRPLSGPRWNARL